MVALLVACGSRTGFIEPREEPPPVQGSCSAPTPIASASWGFVIGDDRHFTFAYDVALDPKGDLFASGNFDTTVDVGGAVLSAPLDGPLPHDASYLVRRGPNALRWARMIPTQGFFPPFVGLAADAVILSGTFEGTVDLGTGLQTAQGRDAFIAAYAAADGAPRWVQTFGTPSDDFGGRVASTCESTYVALNETSSMELRSIDAAGATRWARAFPGNGVRGIADVAATDSLVVIAGHYYGDIDTGAGVLSSTRGDSFVIVFDRAGRTRWTARVSGSDETYVSAVAAVADEVYVAIRFSGTLDVPPIAATGRLSSVILRFDSSGTLVGHRVFGGTDWVPALALVAGKDDVVLAADYTQTLTIDGMTLTAHGPKDSQDAVVVWMDRALAVRRVRSFGDLGGDQIQTLRLDARRAVVMTGWFSTSLAVSSDLVFRRRDVAQTMGFVARVP